MRVVGLADRTRQVHGWTETSLVEDRFEAVAEVSIEHAGSQLLVAGVLL
jgi:hypothetical protein